MSIQPSPQSFDAEAFRAATDVSRETWDKLTLYADLLVKWQRSINLVSASTLPALWHRHMLDSAQLVPLVREAGFEDPVCLDMGTGAGFPGMVLAIMGHEGQGGRWTLVDSDQKKMVFLREVARVTGVSVTILPMRLEGVSNRPDMRKADIITARACAPLADLFAYAEPLMHTGSQAFFLKGQGAAAEMDAARADWSFEAVLHPSRTDPEARIVAISQLRPRGS